MRELREEPLKHHTSLRIGGIARRLVIPESRDEFLAAIRQARKENTPYFVLGRGSNVLANDGTIEKLVIKNTEACRSLKLLDNGEVEAGSSLELQRLIRFFLDHNLGGIEYLQSVPGNVGGGIYMNAGRGREYNQAISDHLVSVDVFDGEHVITLTKDRCGFGYRRSIFRSKDWVILSARFAPPAQARSVGQQLVTERMRHVREAQDNSLPNAGSVFAHRFRLHSHLQGQRVNDAQFSSKTPNWILNLGQATCHDVLRLIRSAQWQHVIRGHLPPSMEWVRLE